MTSNGPRRGEPAAVTVPLAEEFEAFDAMDRDLRDALQYANLKVSAKSAEELMRLGPPKHAVILLIKRMG